MGRVELGGYRKDVRDRMGKDDVDEYLLGMVLGTKKKILCEIFKATILPACAAAAAATHPIVTRNWRRIKRVWAMGLEWT